MNHRVVIPGQFKTGMRIYRSKDGRHDFKFHFVSKRSHIDIYCTRHPSLNGQDPNVHKTHLYSSGKICFHAGREPRSERRARDLASQWAEYYLVYRRTGVPQG